MTAYETRESHATDPAPKVQQAICIGAACPSRACVDCYLLAALGLGALTSLAVLAPLPAKAEYSYGVSYRAEASDNIELTAVDPEHDVVQVGELRFDWARRSPKLDGRIAFRSEYLTYKNDTFDDEFRPELDMNLLWNAIRDRLTWSVQDVASQERIDVTGAPNADNLQTVNLFTTGPDVFFRLGPRSTLRVGARYADAFFEETDEDSARASGTAGWIYALSSTTNLSLNAALEAVRFDDDVLNTDFDLWETYLRIDSKTARSTVGLDLGQTTIDRKGEDPIDQPLLRFTWDRRLTQRSSLLTELAYEVSDAGRDIAIPGFEAGARGGDVFIDRRASILHRVGLRRTTTTVQLFARERDYEIASQDERDFGGRVVLQYRISRTVFASLDGDTQHREFLDSVPVRVDREHNYGFNISYQPGRRLFFSVGGRWRSRDSDDPTQDYRETRAIFEVGYNSSGGYNPVTRPVQY